MTYPDGVTEQSAALSAEKTDKLIKNLLLALQNKSLGSLVLPMLFSDETLSQILLSVYGSMGEQASSLKNMGIDVSTASVSACLANYPSVSSAVAGSADWQSVNLDGAVWNVKNKADFANALAAMLIPFNDVLYMLLCGGTYRSGIIRLRGGDGYESGLVPMLSALGCTYILDAQSYKTQAAENPCSMVYNIVLSVLSFLDEILASPALRLSQTLPNLADFLKNGRFESSVDALMNPLTLGIGKYVSLFSGSSMLSVLMFIQDSSKYTTNFSENMTTILNDAISSSDLKLAQIDLDALASCGTEEDGVIKANVGQSFTTIFLWLFDTLKLNKDKITDMLTKNAEALDPDSVKSVLNGLLEKENAEIFSLIVKLFTAESGSDVDYQWQTPTFTKTAVSYTPNLGAEKYQRVLDGIDDLLNQFVAEGGEEKSLQSMLKKTIYSPDVISQLVLGVYKLLGSDDISKILSVLSLSLTPKAVAEKLVEKQFSRAKSVLQSASSWDNVKAESLDWGFEKGDEKGFKKALTAVLRPFGDLLRMLLVSDKIEVLESVNLCGSNGYNTAVIPLLEALGCPSEKIMNYADFKAAASGDGVIQNLLNPIFALAHKVIKKPVYTLTEILPNIIFFVSNGSLVQCLLNLIEPFVHMLSKFSIDLKALGLDLEELKKLDLLDMISGKVPEISKDIKLAKPNLASVGGIGEMQSLESKAVFGGAPVQMSYVKADQTAVLLTLLRYFVGAISNPENSDLIGKFMGGGNSDDMFAQYSSGIGDQMAEMSTDETIEWLYKLFFRERAVKEEPATDNYSTAIKYVEPKESHTKQLVIAAVIILFIAVIVIIFRKRIFFEVEIMKQNRAAKKAAEKQEV